MRNKFFRCSGLTFPDDEDLPAGFTEGFEITTVSFDISPAFILPEFGVCGRGDPAKTTAVHMPETAVNEDYLFVSDQHNIRVAGKVAAIKGITITHSMDEGANDYFR
jgi:hypothetical protein